MSHASMAGYFLFFYNRYRKEEILKRKEEKLMSLLEVKNVKKIYTTRFGSNQVEALRDVNFTVERGEYVAIMGESGSGKTTLLNILAALDKPTEGKVYLKDRDLGKLKEKEIATFRRQNLGFVFQDFNLLDTFSLKDNIFLPLVLSGKKYPEMEKRLKPIAEKQHVDLVLESFRPVTAEIDEVKLTLAITNLVENAIKYNKEDGWVHVSLNADYQYFYLKVEDSGIGIPEDSLEHIYERFYRVDKSHSREIGGTGLGLAITRNAILMHRGAIKVFSTEGEGTLFTVRIPLNYIA